MVLKLDVFVPDQVTLLTKLPKSIVHMFSPVVWFKLRLVGLTRKVGYHFSLSTLSYKNFSCSKMDDKVCRKSSSECAPYLVLFSKNSLLFLNLSSCGVVSQLFQKQNL